MSIDRQTRLQLSGKVALVTGGSSGIGKCCVEMLAAEGATVLILDKDEAGCHETARELGANGASCFAYPFDLLQFDAIKPLVQRMVASHGPIDILVNSAAMVDSGLTVLDVDVDTWDRIHGVNLKAPMLLIQAVAHEMIRTATKGRIVNITSSSAFRASLSFPSYGSSKAGLTQFTRSAAADLGPHGINVNCVAPGITVTPLLGKLRGIKGAQEMSESGPLANLLHRPSLPEDVASVVLFLCTAGARQITGQTIHTSAGAVV